MNINRFKRRKIHEIAIAGLEGKEDPILLLREFLYSYPSDKWQDIGEDEMVDYIRFLESETDRIAKGEERKKYTEAELEEQEDYEKYCLETEKDDLKKLFETLSKVDY